MDLFGKKNPEKIERTQKIKRRISDVLQLNDDATVMVTELNCQDEDCPETETVIALFRPGLPEIKSTLHSSIEEIGDGEIAEFCRKVQNDPKPEMQEVPNEEIDLPL